MNATVDITDHTPRILIVDDERQNRTLLEAMLTPEGYLLHTAASGEEALAKVAQQPPDLILLDVMMPGMDGYQVARRINSTPATENIPIIIITALDDRNARMLGLSAGAADFLSKPVDRAELCVRVRNLLRLKAYGDYHDRYSLLLEGEVHSRTADLVERAKTLEQQAAVLTEQAALLDLAQDAIVVRDMHDRILFWSRGAEALYGWRSRDVLGRNMRELLRSEYSDTPTTIDATLLRDGQWEGETIHYKRDGTRVIVASRWALQRDMDGAPIRILTINNDITGPKQAEAERLLLTERLSLATAVAKVGVWEWDLLSDSLMWDSTMFEIYGLPSTIPLPYARWAAAVHPEDLLALEAALRRTIDDKGQSSEEFRIVLADGSIRLLSAVERVVLDERDCVRRVIGVTMDVTARKAAEQAVEQSLKAQMRFKDEFLSHVSHELRSPLTAIKQFTTILLGGLAGDLNREQREYQEIVLKNIRQLQSMIDELLEVTRLETGKVSLEPESASIANAITDTFNTLQLTAGAKGVTLTSDVPLELSCAYADPSRLRQILIILLDNAIKFTPDGGAVNVRARILRRDPRFLLLEVSDTGIGISTEITERIFERLYQVSEPTSASRKGLGLGLYICKQLVTRQGGQIWVKRHEQIGSTFSFTLPVFSLDNLLAPLLKNNQWPTASVAVVTMHIGWPNAWPSRASQEEWSHEARSLLQRCLLPDLDVLLPTTSPGAEGERFFIAAFADERGALVLANRIREQFERLPRLKEGGVTLSVTHSMLPPSSNDVAPTTETLVADMATNLEAAIKSQIIAEAIHHG